MPQWPRGRGQSFDRYESKGELTTRQPSVQAAEDTSGEIIQKVGEVGKTVQDVSLKWSNAVDTIQKTTSTANFKTGMLDIINRAQNDPNYNNSDQYFREVEKLKTDNLKGFSSKTAETQMALDLGYDSKVGRLQIENLYKKKMIAQGQVSAMTLVDQEVNNPTENSLSNIKNLLDSQVEVGIIGADDAYKTLQKANENLGIGKINKDLFSAKTPDDVEAVRQAITSGEYEKGGVTIDPVQKRALLGIADKAYSNAKKKVKAQEIEAMAQNRVDTITGLASGQMQFESLNMADIAEYDPQLANTLTKVKDFMSNYNPKLEPKEQALSSAGLMSTKEVMGMKSYARSITDVFLQNDNEKLSEFMLREFEKKGDGSTPSVKLAAFANLAALKYRVNNQQTTQDLEAASKFNAIKTAVKFLEASNPYLAQYSINDFIVRNFISGASTKKQIMQEAKNTLEDQIINRYKSVAKLSSLPNKVVDGEASVEDLHSGLNELDGDRFSGNYSDQDRSE